jgi:large subunit ribosomal protein L22
MAATSEPSAEYSARHRFAPLPARKARLAADMIRGLDVNRALETLQFSPKRSSYYLLKVLKSAMANASQDEGVNVNRLFVARCFADDGPLKNGHLRYRPGPQGRALPIRRRTSHLTVVVSERAEPQQAKGERGSRGKKRARKVQEE